jgi:hypothetical protein
VANNNRQGRHQYSAKKHGRQYQTPQANKHYYSYYSLQSLGATEAIQLFISHRGIVKWCAWTSRPFTGSNKWMLDQAMDTAGNNNSTIDGEEYLVGADDPDTFRDECIRLDHVEQLRILTLHIALQLLQGPSQA